MMITNKKKKTKPRKTTERPCPARIQELPIPHCVTNYAKGLIDPFDVDQDICLPLPPGLPSAKYNAFARGSGTIGTAGFGFALANTNYGRDDDTVSHSTSAFTGTSTAISGTGVTQVTPTALAGSGTYAPGVLEGRLVSAGVRVRYTGTELNRSGIVIALEEPHHDSLATKTIANLQQYDKGVAQDFDRDWTSVTFQPITTAESNYNVNHGNNNHFMCIAVTGVPGETFAFEWRCHYEAIGTSARGKTPTPVYNDETLKMITAIAQVPSADWKLLATHAMTTVQFLGKAYQHLYGAPRQRIMY